MSPRMKIAASALIVLAGACASSPGPDAHGGPPPDHGGGPMPGGYADQDPASPEIQAAAAKAVELLKERTQDPSLALERVISASTQVVAGQNYRLELALTSSAGPRTVRVVLYRDLQGACSLTSVE
ncbi:MAG: hypothetical protein IT372_03020 [Polyangiaceae bacterium]|nr:hypothetical protein [Polyangiaceae bacterium]